MNSPWLFLVCISKGKENSKLKIKSVYVFECVHVLVCVREKKGACFIAHSIYCRDLISNHPWILYANRCYVDSTVGLEIALNQSFLSWGSLWLSVEWLQGQPVQQDFALIQHKFQPSNWFWSDATDFLLSHWHSCILPAEVKIKNSIPERPDGLMCGAQSASGTAWLLPRRTKKSEGILRKKVGKSRSL